MSQLHDLESSRRHPNADRRGTAILPALIVVVLVATLSMVYVQVSLAKNKEQRGSVDAKRAFYMAEAGLAEGFNGLCLGKSGNVASEDTPAEFGVGIFWTKATELGQGRVKLESTGLCGAGRAALAMTVERQPDSIGALGFFGDQAITVEGGALIDSYDSRSGPYTGQALLAPIGSLLSMGAKVGGNADITVLGTLLRPAKVYGDVKPGPQGTLFRSANSIITGSMAPSASTIPFPAVEIPVVASGTDLTVKSGVAETLSSGLHGVKKIKVKSGGALTIYGPTTIVADSLELEARGALKIDATSGPVKVFIKEGLNLAASSHLGTLTNDPLGISIQVAGTQGVTLETNGNFYGSIYAPNTAVSIPSSFIVYGAVVAKDLTLKAGGQLHFDRALTATSSESNGTPRLLGWHIVELPNVAIVQLRYDALADLIRQGKTPQKARDAHREVGEDDDD